MTALSPDQLQAIQAVLQQQAPALAEDIAQSIAVTVQSSTANLDNLARTILLQGTALDAGSLDQILFRSGQGDFLLNIPQLNQQALQNSLPSRVVLQLRPGPNGLEAILVVGNKAIQNTGQPEQSLASGSASGGNQTLASEIPKIGQVFETTVLPSTLLPTLLGNKKFLRGSDTDKPVEKNHSSVADVKSDAPRVPDGMQAVKNINFSSSQTGALGGAKALPNLLAGVFQKFGLAPQIAETAKSETALLQKPAQDVSAAEKTASNPAPINITPKPAADFQATAIQQQSVQKLPLRILGILAQEPQRGEEAQPAITAPQDKTVPDHPAEKNFVATVRGSTLSGQPILSLDQAPEEGLVVVRTNKNWPIGTKLQVSLGAGAGIVMEKELPRSPQPWDGIRQVMELIAQQSPAALKEVIRLRVPQTNPSQMPGALLFFMMAMQRGNLAAWLGDDAEDELEALGRKDIWQRLQDDLGAVKQGAVDTNGTNWRGMMVPYLDQDKIQHFRFYVHDDKSQHKNEANKKDWARRFLIDVTLSRLGPVQVDGLVHKKKLDLIVRTINRLPEVLRDDLRKRFHRAMEETRYVGSLSFQANRQGWVELKQAAETHISKAL